MSRRADTRNRIRGPQSALTDFLAANNISAAQINADYHRRVSQARQNPNQPRERNGADQDGEDENEVGDGNEEIEIDDIDDDDDDDDDDDEVEDTVEKRKRKRKDEKLKDKIKQAKQAKRRGHRSRKIRDSDDNNSEDDSDGSDSNGDSNGNNIDDGDDGGDSDDDIIRSSNKIKSKAKAKATVKTKANQATRMPGQLDNCAVCGKRFTVTPYSKAGPDGGLLCPKCSKEAKDYEKLVKKAAAARRDLKKTMSGARRRLTESDRMMGDVQPGAKSLLDCCIRKVADVANDIDDFGDLPQRLLDRLSRILSKKRVLTPRTLGLFLRSDCDSINVYDSAKLEEEDFQRIFAHMTHVVSVNLRFAGQMKDEALLYMTDKCPRLRHLQLGAVNLISDAAWDSFFIRRGGQIESLKLSELNDSLHYDTVLKMTRHCAQLRRLKLRSCSHMNDASVAALASLSQLEHLTLSVASDTTTAATLSHLITSVGPNLRTLCLESFVHADDTTLAAIHTHCRRLSKLRLTGSTKCTDSAFAALFTSWANPAIPYLDLSSNRDVDELAGDTASADSDDENAEEAQARIGLGSSALKAIMLHSGSALKHLDLHSDRHIDLGALLDVFDGQSATRYTFLRDIDLSFVSAVDDVVIRGIFRTCPNLKKLVLFACFNACRGGGGGGGGSGLHMPPGVAIVGLPNAHDHIIQGDSFGF